MHCIFTSKPPVRLSVRQKCPVAYELEAPMSSVEIPDVPRVTRFANYPTSRARWVLCGLLFLATTTNYMDRQVLGILAPLLEKEMHWT